MISVAKYFMEHIEIPTLLEVEGLNADYRFVKAYTSNTSETMLLLTGFGSGWEGIAETACRFVDEGFNVILLSLPGYGSSENISSKNMWKNNHFEQEGQWINKFIQVFCDTHGTKYNINFVGHSMGATILAEAAAQEGCRACSLTMIAPSNAKIENFFLPVRFVWSGIWMRIVCRDQFKCLYGVVQSQQSCWIQGRWHQRWHELKCTIKGKLLCETIQEITVPMRIISGRRDMVYPPEIFNSISFRVDVYVNSIFHHNPTIPHTKELVDLVVKFIHEI